MERVWPASLALAFAATTAHASSFQNHLRQIASVPRDDQRVITRRAAALPSGTEGPFRASVPERLRLLAARGGYRFVPKAIEDLFGMGSSARGEDRAPASTPPLRGGFDSSLLPSQPIVSPLQVFSRLQAPARAPSSAAESFFKTLSQLSEDSGDDKLLDAILDRNDDDDKLASLSPPNANTPGAGSGGGPSPSHSPGGGGGGTGNPQDDPFRNLLNPQPPNNDIADEGPGGGGGRNDIDPDTSGPDFNPGPNGEDPRNPNRDFSQLPDGEINPDQIPDGTPRGAASGKLVPAGKGGNPGFMYRLELGRGALAGCQATLISASGGMCIAATAAHCLTDVIGSGAVRDRATGGYSAAVTMHSADFGVIGAQVFMNAAHESQDSGALVFECPEDTARKMPVIPLAETPIRPGERIAYGKVMGGREGLYTGRTGLHKAWTMRGTPLANVSIEMYKDPGQAATQQGDSGGPLLRVDANGKPTELVGVLTGSSPTENIFAARDAMNFIRIVRDRFKRPEAIAEKPDKPEKPEKSQLAQK